MKEYRYKELTYTAKGLFVWATSVPFTVNGTNVVKLPNSPSIEGTLILGTLTLQRTVADFYGSGSIFQRGQFDQNQLPSH
jgi:hypothetical protein